MHGRKNKPKRNHLLRGQDENVTEVSLGRMEAFCGNINMGIPAHTLKGPASVFLPGCVSRKSSWTNLGSEPLLWAHSCVYRFTASRCIVRILGKSSIWHMLCVQFCSCC